MCKRRFLMFLCGFLWLRYDGEVLFLSSRILPTEMKLDVDFTIFLTTDMTHIQVDVCLYFFCGWTKIISTN